MTKLLLPPSEADLTPEVVGMAVPPFKEPGVRCAPVLRIERRGQILFVQHCEVVRSLGPDGKEVLTDNWKNVAVSKPPDAWNDAFKWMIDANRQLLNMSNGG